ncbi:uncharacterized protein LOC118195279 isoform X2 [Stegodyphus dumicola]|uniref:uncharacterized protein LOC118195279 isoform X2 n=1 Tax=Stegodyphus dumicola TaxID=202533 RepID=UPI0015AAA1E7|nr:uncharacterized protein LOC118195279 isoform X2 [Stegodyphus dumicola]
MPKKARGKYKSYRPVSNYSEAEIFRNSSAVLDDTDPVESLRYLKEIFKDKLEEDVIVMIFSECAYNVDQACETLMSLANEGNVEQSLSQKSVDCSETVNETNKEKIDPNPETQYQDAFRDNEFNKSVEYLPDTRNASIGNWISDCNWTKKNDFIHKSEVQTNSLNHTHQNWIYQSSSMCRIPDNSELNAKKSNEYVNDVKEGHSMLMPISPSAFSYGNQHFADSKPQFITPFLPTSSHKHKSGGKSPYSPENNQPHFCSLPNKQSSSLPDKGTKKYQKDALRYAIEKIQSGQNVLIILRGLPGSGKSSLARKMKFSGAVFSTDDFFYKKGKYAFDPNQLTEAHAWNKIRTRNALEKGVTPVIIDNTNTEVWEMVPYIFLGKKFNYEIVILEPNTPWKFNVKELAKRNKHHVSKEKIAKMKERYQRNVNVESIMQSLNLMNSEKSNLSTESDVVKFPVKDSRQIYSDNSESHDSSEEKGKSISFEAVIHQEEDPSDLLSNKAVSLDDCMSYSQSSVDSSELPETNSTSSLINQDCDFSNKLDKHQEFMRDFESNDICGSLSSKDKTVYNLDELRALMREDSEESQSVSHNDSLNGSNQDVSCWESITEHDDDFLWRNASCDVVENSLSNNEMDFLRLLKENEDEKNDLSQSYENISSKLSNLNLVEEDSFTNDFFQDVSEINIASAENLSDNKSHMQQSNLNSINSAHEENCPTINKKDRDISFNLNEENFSLNLNPKVLLSFSKQANFPDEQDFSHSETRMSENYTSDSNIFNVNAPVRNEVAEISKLFQLKCAVDCDSNVKSSEIRNEVSKNLEKKDELINANNYSLQNLHSDLNICVIEPLSITEETGTIKSENLEPTVPKPQRSGKNLPLMFSRNSANNAHMQEKLEILETPVTFDDSIEWETVSSKSDTATDDNSSQNSNSEIENSPKPQRNICDMQDVFKFKNKAQNSYDLGNVQNINDVKTEENKEQNTNSSDARYSYNTKIWIPRFLKNVGEIDSDWKFPEFARYNIDKEEKEEDNTISVKTSCTQTEPNDFVIICKLENGSLLDCPLEYRILICNKSTIIDELQEKCSSDIVYDNIPQTAKFEKSTSTADLACDSEKYEKLSHLHECFPDISEEDLLHLLDICHGDESWLSNILLEWGYKYNVQNRKENEVSCANDVEKPKFNINLSSDSNLKNSEEEICSIDNQEKSKKLKIDEFNVNSEEYSDNLKKTSLLEMQLENNTLSGNSSAALPFKNMQLILDPAFAWQLEELFGPVTTHSSDGPLSASDRIVEIDMEFAKLIYDKWKKTSETKLKSSKKEEKVKNVPLFKNKEFTSAELKVPLEKSSNESLSFSEIMDMQYALELHKQEKLRKDRNFETKLKRLKLYKMFPGADTVVLDEIFECNNCCLEDCIKALGEDFGEPKSARHKKDLEKIETCVTEWNESNIFQDFGQNHGFQCKQANKKASELIAQERNICSPRFVLDLHGLYIQEAIPTLEKFLRDRKLELRRHQQVAPQTVSIVTGQGLHSIQGPKLRPSVMEYLKKTGYGFSEVNQGVLEVTLNLD